MNEKTNRRIIIILTVLVLILGAGLIYILGPGRVPASVSDRMERLQTQLRAAYQGQETLGVQLARVSGSLIETQDSISSGIAGLAHGQQLTIQILDAIADSNDAERVVEGAVVGISSFIDRVEAFNQPGTAPPDD